jgi:serine/threonine protein kinase
LISQEAKSFVDKCLLKDPSTRINITEILQHDWIKKYVSEEQRIKDNNLEMVQSHEILKILCSDAI